MRIIHCCLSCFYIDGYTYQENMLVREHVSAGHDVLVLASTESYDKDGQVCYLQPSSYVGNDGAFVKRLPYLKFLPSTIARKIRAHPGVFKELEEFEPDVILFHGMCGFELYTVARYTSKNPGVSLYADSHEDFNNSATTFLSRNVLYRLFYVPIIKISLKHILKVLYITHETKLFCRKVYGLDDQNLEYYPLGGVVLDDTNYYEKRIGKRAEIKVSEDQIVYLQTGKFDKNKKLNHSISAFITNAGVNSKFIIAGVFPTSEDEREFHALIETDHRIEFVGWVDAKGLTDLLCACDVYLQPGSQSATMQMALALRCAVVLDDVPSHNQFFCSNGFLLNSQNTIEKVIGSFSYEPETVTQMQKNSHKYAEQFLDYTALANRILNKDF